MGKFSELYKKLKAEEKVLEQQVNEMWANRETVYENNFTYNKFNLEKEAISKKAINIYDVIIQKVPLEKREQLNEELKQICFEDKRVERNFNQFIKKRVKDGYDAAYLKINLFKNPTEILDKIEAVIPENEIDNILKECDNYKIPSQAKVKVHLLDQKIQDAKQYLENQNIENKQEIIKELDLINEVVIGATAEHRDEISVSDGVKERGRNLLRYSRINEYIKENNPEGVKYIVPNDIGGSDFKEDVASNDIAGYNKMRGEIKYEISEKHKKSTLRVLKEFEKRGIYNPIDDGHETGIKVYGFRQIFDAQLDLAKAIENKDFSNLKQLRENYETSLQNMREIYAIVKEEFDPNPKNMVGNLENLRHDYVPLEFCDEIEINSTVSSLYNMYAIIRNVGCSPEEFVEDPYKYLNKFSEKAKLERLNIDKKAEGKSIAEVLAYASFNQLTPDAMNAYPSTSLMRASEGLANREEDMSLKSKLEYNASLSFSVDGNISKYNVNPRKQMSYCASHYLDNKSLNTIANILLVNDQDRQYSQLRGYNYYDIKDDISIIQAFDTADYISKNEINPVELAERIKQTVQQFSALRQKEIDGCNKPELDKLTHIQKVNERFADVIKGSQRAIEMFMIYKNPQKNEPGIQELNNMLKDPAKMFGDIQLDEATNQIVNNLKNKTTLEKNVSAEKAIKTINSKSNDLAKKSIKEERKAEKQFNSSAEKLSKQIAKLESKGKDSTEKRNSLEELKRLESERLNDKFKNNRLPKNYLDQRLQNLNNNLFNAKVQLFDDGALSKSDYIKSTGLDDLSRSEKNSLYDSYKLKLQNEKETFFKREYLVKSDVLVKIENKVEQNIQANNPVNNEPVLKEKISVNLEQEGKKIPVSKQEDYSKAINKQNIISGKK